MKLLTFLIFLVVSSQAFAKAECNDLKSGRLNDKAEQIRSNDGSNTTGNAKKG